MQQDSSSKNKLITFLSIAVIVLPIVIAILSFQGISNMVSSSKQQVVENAAQNVLDVAVAAVQDEEQTFNLEEVEHNYNSIEPDQDVTVSIEHDEETGVVTVRSEGWDGAYSSTVKAPVAHE